jgi:hypothetical protein
MLTKDMKLQIAEAQTNCAIRDVLDNIDALNADYEAKRIDYNEISHFVDRVQRYVLKAIKAGQLE